MSFSFCYKGHLAPIAYVFQSSEYENVTNDRRRIHLYSGKAIPTKHNPLVVQPIAMCGWDERHPSGHPSWIQAIAVSLTDPETGKPLVNCPDCLYPAPPERDSQQADKGKLTYITPPRDTIASQTPPTQFEW